MSTSDDEFRDPTAPPPLPEAPADDTADTAPADDPGPTPAADDTQVVDPSATQAFESPSGGYEAPSYSQPTYATPSYEQPSYDRPAYGAPADGPPTPPGPAPAPPPWGAPTGGYTPPPADPSPYGAYPPPTPPPGPGPAGQAPYAAPGPYPYAGAPSVYGVPQRNTGALVLTILSGVAVLFCCGVLNIPSLVLGIIGLTKQDSDPEGSRRMTRAGWIAFAVGIGITVLAFIGLIAWGIATDSSSSSYDYEYDGNSY